MLRPFKEKASSVAGDENKDQPNFIAKNLNIS